MIEKVKDNLHFVLIVNLMLTFLILINGSSEGSVNLIAVGGNNSESSEESLREVICREAFKGWREGELSNFYIHPEVISFIKNTNKDIYKMDDVIDSYFEMKGREVCLVILKKKDGFTSFEAVISKNGPLLYRVTSLNPKKPELTKIKELF